MTDDYDIGDELLVPVIAGLLQRYVGDVRRTSGAPLPRLRSAEFFDADEQVQVAVLVLLGSAWLWGPPGLATMKDVSLDIHGGNHRLWRQVAADRQFRRPRAPRTPARCEHCHERLTAASGDGGAAA